MQRLIALFVTIVMLIGCYDSRFEEPHGDTSGPATTMTLAKLRELYKGVAFTLESEVIVSGVVTTCDRDGNFYRTFCIEDDGAGAEIMAGIDHLHNDYPIGSRVTIRIKGLAVGESYGVLQIGRKPAPGSGFATDYIGGTKAEADAHISRTGNPLQVPEPAVRTLEDLMPAMYGMLVRIESLHYAPEDLSEGTWAGYKRFTDPEGRELFTYVRPYAGFAENDVPAEVVSLTGILQYDTKGNGRYLLKLRDENDCAY